MLSYEIVVVVLNCYLHDTSPKQRQQILKDIKKAIETYNKNSCILVVVVITKVVPQNLRATATTILGKRFLYRKKAAGQARKVYRATTKKQQQQKQQ